MNAEISIEVRGRIQQAEDALKAVDALLKERLWRDAFNRSYYAMFYGVLALLAWKGLGTSKHSGAIAFFDREFVKTGAFGKETSEALHKAFEGRLEADYDQICSLGEEDTMTMAGQARHFVGIVSDYLRKQGVI